MNYAKIRTHDIANGEGVRTSLFVSGCTLHCPGCFNTEAQDFSFGTPFTEQTIKEIEETLKDPVVTGLSILGGEPLDQDNDGLLAMIELCDITHRLGKNVWMWTGHVWEDVFEKPCELGESRHKALTMRLLAHCDVVVDGPFRMDLADRFLKWRGSSNQRIIDAAKTVWTGCRSAITIE